MTGAIYHITEGEYRAAIHPDMDAVNPREDCEPFGHMIGWHRNYQVGDKHSYEDTEALFRDIIGEDRYGVCERRYERRLDSLERAGLTDRAFDAERGRLWRDFMDELRIEVEKVAVILPLYIYDHGNVAYSTGPFSCPWDSGQVGWVYATRQEILDNWGRKALNRNLRIKAVKLLESEVETYSEWANGSVYGYVIEKLTEDEDGDTYWKETEEACWGYIGMEAVEDEAKGVLKRLSEKEAAHV